jgi:hypothetical protein
MSGGLGGALGMVIGTGLSIAGQRKGAKAMKQEAIRQAEEQEGFDTERLNRVDRHVASVQPGNEPLFVGQQASRMGAAMVPSAQAAGSALGVRVNPLNAQARASMGAGGAAMRGDIDELERARLGQELVNLDRRRALASALYEGRMMRAGKKGQSMRQAGELFSTVGGAQMNYAMGEPRQKAAPDWSQGSTDWKGFSSQAPVYSGNPPPAFQNRYPVGS